MKREQHNTMKGTKRKGKEERRAFILHLPFVLFPWLLFSFTNPTNEFLWFIFVPFIRLISMERSGSEN